MSDSARATDHGPTSPGTRRTNHAPGRRLTFIDTDPIRTADADSAYAGYLRLGA
ncbi:MAG: hypothetical protein IPH03_12265 [Tetrasphaera sp.]|nr:hypothetical protein [Tetrasphaera sp.]